MSPSVSKAVLVTGCSSGIGRATAELLGRGDWAVLTFPGGGAYHASKCALEALSAPRRRFPVPGGRG